MACACRCRARQHRNVALKPGATLRAAVEMRHAEGSSVGLQGWRPPLLQCAAVMLRRLHLQLSSGRAWPLLLACSLTQLLLSPQFWRLARRQAGCSLRSVPRQVRRGSSQQTHGCAVQQRMRRPLL